MFSWISEFRNKCPFCRSDIKQLVCDNLLNEMSAFFLQKLPTTIHHNQIKTQIITINQIEMGKIGAVVEKMQAFPGLFVKEVDKDSASYLSGLRAGDTIISINAKPIIGMKEFKELFARFAQKCEFFITKRKLIHTDSLNIKAKQNGNYLMITNNHNEMKSGSYIKSCNGYTGLKMSQEILKLGGTIDGKRLRYCTSKKLQNEVVIVEL